MDQTDDRDTTLVDPTGEALYQRVLGKAVFDKQHSKPLSGVRELTINHLFAKIWSRSPEIDVPERLTLRERRLVTIALLATQGRPDQLKDHLVGACRAGLGEPVLIDLMVHVAHYAGWAAGTSGQTAVQDVFNRESDPMIARAAAGVETDVTDGAIASAIALARRNRDPTPQEYYDEQADALDRDVYYRGLDPLADPAELYTALSRLVTQTHRTKLDYRPAIHLYPDVDLQPKGQITSVYSGQQMDPEDLIRADADIDRARRAALRTLAEGRAVSMSDVAEFANRIEAALPYNCEHVVPQSWFAKNQPMKGDLHHLFACEIKCNSFRANIPYFDFEQDDIEQTDCGQADPGKFEPLGGKGAVARATLYFLLRYPGEIDNNEREYTRERLNVLLRWTRDHPITVHERHRNRLIQAKQGNRNPLIDLPDWTSRIDFTRGLR